jgi:hypothetical protein
MYMSKNNSIIQIGAKMNLAKLVNPTKLRCALMPESLLHCEACGESFPMPGGDVKWVVAVSNAFDRAHRNCKRK